MDKDIEFFSDLNRLLRENIKTIDEFKSENDIYDLNFLGRGDFGEAYSTGDGRVVKFTSSKSEFNIARQLEGNDSPVFNSFAKVFKTDLVDGKMTIIMEELELDSSIESLFYELIELLETQGLPIQYLDHLDYGEIPEVSDELERFIDAILDINTAHRHLGIEASDIRPENLGYDSTGKLKAFDIDDRRK